MAPTVSYYQGGACVVLLSPQGKTPCADWNCSGSIKKHYEKSIKGFLFHLAGTTTTTSLEFPKKKSSTQLTQPFLIFQARWAAGKQISMEVCCRTTKNVRARIVLSTSFREIVQNSLHAQVPLIIKNNESNSEGSWMNIVLDLNTWVEGMFPGQSFRSLESVRLSGSCEVRRIFTMKDPPRPSTTSTTIDAKLVDIPKDVAFPSMLASLCRTLYYTWKEQEGDKESTTPSKVKLAAKQTSLLKKRRPVKSSNSSTAGAAPPKALVKSTTTASAAIPPLDLKKAKGVISSSKSQSSLSSRRRQTQPVSTRPRSARPGSASSARRKTSSTKTSREANVSPKSTVEEVVAWKEVESEEPQESLVEKVVESVPQSPPKLKQLEFSQEEKEDNIIEQECTEQDEEPQPVDRISEKVAENQNFEIKELDAKEVILSTEDDQELKEKSLDKEVKTTAPEAPIVLRSPQKDLSDDDCLAEELSPQEIVSIRKERILKKRQELEELQRSLEFEENELAASINNIMPSSPIGKPAALDDNDDDIQVAYSSEEENDAHEASFEFSMETTALAMEAAAKAANDKTLPETKTNLEESEEETSFDFGDDDLENNHEEMGFLDSELEVYKKERLEEESALLSPSSSVVSQEGSIDRSDSFQDIIDLDAEFMDEGDAASFNDPNDIDELDLSLSTSLNFSISDVKKNDTKKPLEYDPVLNCYVDPSTGKYFDNNNTEEIN